MQNAIKIMSDTLGEAHNHRDQLKARIKNAKEQINELTKELADHEVKCVEYEKAVAALNNASKPAPAKPTPAPVPAKPVAAPAPEKK